MDRNEEVKVVADFIRKMTGAPGVVVMVLDTDACPFGYALGIENEAVLRAALPDKLREVAAILEREQPKAS